MKTVQLIFQYTQSEYVRAVRQYLIASKMIRKFDIVLAPLLLLYSIGYVFISDFSIFSIIIALIVLIGTVLGSFLYFFMPIAKFKQTSKYHAEYTMIFSQNAIKWKTQNTESQLKWNIYSELWESNDFYFLIQGPRMYTLIPKRVFASQEEKQIFEEIVLAKLKSSKRI